MLTAKDIEQKFTNKQIISYNNKLKRQLDSSNFQLNVLRKNQDSIIKNEIDARTKIIYEEANKENKILESRALTAEDLNRRLEKKNNKLQNKIDNMKLTYETSITQLNNEINDLKSELNNKNLSIKELNNIIKNLENKVQELQCLLNNDSTTCSIPTSKTPINKKKLIPNSRVKSNKNIGGQEGHPKHELDYFNEEEISQIIYEELDKCCYCNSDTIKDTGNIIYKDEYQYKIIVEKIRHAFVEYKCLNCGKKFTKEIPNNLIAKNQYGNSIQATAIALMNIGNVPINKVKRIIEGLTLNEISLSEGYISKLQKRASNKLIDFIVDLKKKIISLEKIHWDDTVIDVNQKRECIRFYGNEELALYTAHETKGMSGLDEDGILNILREDQCVIHDHNKVNYNDKYDFCNIECNAHLLRDLEKVSINLPNREWSKKLKNHIEKYDHLRKEKIANNIDKFSDEEINNFFIGLDESIILGCQENEKDKDSYYSDKEKTLLERILEYRDNYTYWVLDFGIPFTNNLSERSLRGIKSKMKISGQFQNIKSAKYYANIRSYIETCHRNGINEYLALERLMSDDPFTIEEIISYKKVSKS